MKNPILLFKKLISAGLFVLLLGGTVWAQEEARFSFNVVGPDVRFTDNSSGVESSRTWNFGDGSSSTEVSPTHFYAVPDTYVVSLTVNFASGNFQTSGRRIIIPDHSDAGHWDVAIQKNSQANALDVLKKDGYPGTDHEIHLISGAFSGNPYVSTNLDTLYYTPNMDFTGWDVVEYEILNTLTSMRDTGYVYFDVYDGNCAYSLGVVSSWDRCPHVCDFGGNKYPYGQPTPGQCYGYIYYFQNTSNDTIREMNATLEVDHHMGILEGTGRIEEHEGIATGAQVVVEYDSARHKVTFELAEGQKIAPHEWYVYSFNVDVLTNPAGGPGSLYHTTVNGVAACDAGQGEANHLQVDDKEGGACDPNEISVSPVGCGPNGVVGRDQTLTYTIEFENEGTGPAYEVNVRDVLPDGLDITSVEIVDGSPFHPQLIMNPAADSQEVNFYFHNINLPPLSEDTLHNKGFVTFTVDILPNTPDSVAINNWAEIYFDQQLPILTDTTNNIVLADPYPVSHLMGDTVLLKTDQPCYLIDPAPTGGSGSYNYSWADGAFTASSLTLCPFANGYIGVLITDANTGCKTYDRHYYSFVDSFNTTSINESLIQPLSVNVYPNPFSQRTQIRIEGEETTEIELEVFNNMGKKVANLYRGHLIAGRSLEFEFDGQNLPSGMYFYSLRNNKGLRQTGKMVLVK